MTISFDLSIYSRLSPEARLYALGLMPQEPIRSGEPIRSFAELGHLLKHGPIEGKRFDELADTKRRFDRAHRDRKGNDRPFTATPTGRALFTRYDILPKLAAYIAGPEAQKACPRHLRRLIRLVDFDTLALVAIDALINAVVAGWDWEDESCGMKVALSIGKDLLDEIEMARLRDPDGIDHRRVMEATNRHVAISRYRTLEWSDPVKVRAGWWLLGCAMQCDLFDTEEREIGRWRNVIILPKIADGHWEEIKKLRAELSLARPYYRPHEKAPPDWTSWRTEYGPDRMPATFVRDEHPDTIRSIERAFEGGMCREHAEGVSRVQRVPWAINEFMVPVVEKLAEHVEQRRFKNCGEDLFRAAVDEDIRTARRLIGRPFWTPYNIDFRGRLNPLPYFNIAREDRVRCLFLFHNGEEIGDNARWLEIAVANAAGKEKREWDKRHDWVHDHRDLIRRVARDPIGTVEHWKDFSDPFYFVAACHELMAAQNDPYFKTRLPVFLDGTANGIQHLALMTRDEDSGRYVNLTDAEQRYDPYAVIFERDKLKLQVAGDKHAEWWLSRRGNRDRLFRKLFKQPVMTFSYGVTLGGVRDQIVEAYKEEFDLSGTEFWEYVNLHEPEFWEHINYLAKMIMATTKEVLRRPAEAMEYIRGLAALQAWRNLPLCWITPSGLPVSSNRCYEPNTRPVELKLKGRRVEYLVADGRKDKIIPADAINDAPANFVHSMDAAHLVIAVNAAATLNITDVAVIHDCYGARAPQIERFKEVVQLTLPWMYYNFDVLAILADGCGPIIGPLATPPPRGKLVLNDIRTAEYPFT